MYIVWIPCIIEPRERAARDPGGGAGAEDDGATQSLRTRAAGPGRAVAFFFSFLSVQFFSPIMLRKYEDDIIKMRAILTLDEALSLPLEGRAKLLSDQEVVILESAYRCHASTNQGSG